MLPANGPASGREHARQPGYCLWPDPQFGDADGQARRMLDADVLDIYARLVCSVEQPGQLAWPVRDDHLHSHEVPPRPAVLAGDAVHPGDPPLQQVKLLAVTTAYQLVGIV